MLLAPIAAAVAVAAVAGGVVALRHGGSDAGSPPRLALVDAAVPAENQAGAAAGTEPVPLAGGGYTVAGSLPSGPARAAVRTLPGGQASAAAVGKLAAALGLSATQKRVAGAWTVDAGDRSLRVIDGSGWQWLYDNARRGTGGTMACDVIVNGRRLCLPGRPIPGGGGKVTPIDPPAADPGDGGNSSSGGGSTSASPGTGTGDGSAGKPGSEPNSSTGSSGSSGGGVGSYPGTAGTSVPGPSGGIAVDPPPGGPVPVPKPGSSGVAVPVPVEPTGPTPDEAAVRAAAAPVLAALGLGNAEIRVETFPSIAIVTAAPVVAGLPTAGFDVRLQYNAKIELTGGSGWLAAPAAGAEYPLVSAQRALDALPKPGVVPQVCTDRMPPSCAAPPRVVTGARLGLALRHDQQAGPLLVPAWLYTLKGSDLPLVVVAVDPKYLGTATPDRKDATAPPPVDLPASGPRQPIPLPEPTK
jgi:hypothetical protein